MALFWQYESILTNDQMTKMTALQKNFKKKLLKNSYTAMGMSHLCSVKEKVKKMLVLNLKIATIKSGNCAH